MKIRQGFVSNSSSSSFCIYGTEISDLLYDEKLNEMLKDVKLEYHNDDEDEDIDSDIIREKIETLLEKTNFEMYSICGEQLFVGRDFIDIGDNETGKQFKESTEKEIKALFKGVLDDFEFSSMEEAWGNY